MNERSNGHSDSTPAISVENISKLYRIGMEETRHDTLMQSALAWLRSPLSNYRGLYRLSHFDEGDSEDIIWALRDVSFQVYPGEVVGIVGRNGAGKSTLLKILSRITPPSAGRVVLNGRVSSLLEVGTGFHPELTGRENVYLNGTILGMSKAEVDRKFDEIVAFSEVEKFIDTPVKRYSSGMRVRLAFAVSAHLESEILLVDEVLAVGDAAFQQKCLDTMGGVADSGRTVLFVSHNMQAVQRLCTSAYLIDQGQLAAQGETSEVIRTYLQESFSEPLDEPVVLGDVICLRRITVLQDGYRVGEYVDNNRTLELRITYDLLRPVRNLHLGFDIFSRDGAHLFRTYDMDAVDDPLRQPGSYESVYHLPPGSLRTGFYYFELVVGVHRHGFLSRGKIRVKLNFDGVRETDVWLPGVVGDLGQWHIDENVDPDAEHAVIPTSLPASTTRQP
jgi:lipopolysaccharide transport system ATP-binding protein